MITRFSRHATLPLRTNVPLSLAGGVLPVKPQAASHSGMRILASVLLVVGVLLTIGSIFADQLNLTGGGVGLGWKQLIGVVVGLVLALLGGAWLVQPPTSRGIDRPLE
jgi:hypothetical protein